MEVGKNLSQRSIVLIMEVTQLGVRTRARALAMLKEEIADNSRPVKRRKIGNEKLRSGSSTFVETKVIDHEIQVNSVFEDMLNNCCDVAASRRSSGVMESCCSSSTGSMEKESVDQTEAGIARYNLDGRKSTPGELESPAVKKKKKLSIVMNNSSSTFLPVEKMAPEAELEEFFAAAQEGLNERFKNKYNFDIVNDIPLKGRFEWIQVNPANKNDNDNDDDDVKEDD